jgi:large subunit ribosomal protein L25
MAQFALKAESRSTTGKEKAKKQRANGAVPAIVYGAGKQPVSITTNTREADLMLARIAGEKVLVDLSYDAVSEKVFVRNVQRDPVSDRLLHIDFYRVDMAQELETAVKVTEVGVPEGVKLGGMLQHSLRQISIRCLPANVPPHIEVNVAHLKAGQSIHVRDLARPEGVRFLTPDEAVLFAVVGKAADEPAAPKV